MFQRAVLFSIILMFFVHVRLQATTWRCHNGRQVIAFSKRCDARTDCSDGSDETFRECHNVNCTEHQCSYGGCFSESQLCDVTPDCWDKTDEHPHLCHREQMAVTQPMDTVITLRCLDNQSRCSQTDECLDKKYFCDGVRDCQDDSDEANGNCIASKCPNDTFRCAYGGCLAKAKACDHKIDCWDGTDELPSICFEMRGKPQSGIWPSYAPRRNATNRTRSTVLVYPQVTPPSNAPESTSGNASCIIPSSLKNLQVKTLFNVLPHTSGSSISGSVVVRLSCHRNSHLNGNDLNHCLNGIWQGPWPQCTPTCSHKQFNTDLSIRAFCSYKGVIKSCKRQDTKLFIGTSATVTCAPSYRSQNFITSETRLCEMHHKTGVPVWKSKKNPRLQCIPDCGKKLPTVQEDPWLVSIFTSDISLSNYTYKCNGLIISPWLVFVEKLCTEESNVMRYAIAEGNRWASFVRNEEHPYELHNVANTFHGQQETILQMVNPLILSASVRPICLPPIPGTGTMTYYTQLTRYITTLDNQKIYYLVNISLEFLNQMKLFEINAQRGPIEGLN